LKLNESIKCKVISAVEACRVDILGEQLLLVSSGWTLPSATKTVLSSSVGVTFVAPEVYVLIVGLSSAQVWDTVRYFRFHFEKEIASAPIAALSGNDIGNSVGFDILRPQCFVVDFLLWLRQRTSLTEYQLKCIRRSLIKNVPLAIRNVLRRHWHDIRNALFLLTRHWELLRDEPELSWAFAAEETDAWSSLCARTSALSQECKEFTRLMCKWFPYQHLHRIESIFCTVFTVLPEQSPVLSVFLDAPAPRHPQSKDPQARKRYEILKRQLLSAPLRSTMMELLAAIDYVDTQLLDTIRGS